MTASSGPAGLGEEAERRSVAKAMADPVRSKILNAVAEAAYTGPPVDVERPVGSRGLSVRQIADRTGEPRRRVRYHLDALREDGIVAIAEQRKRKGVVERFFALVRPPLLSDDDVSDLPQKQQRKMLVNCIKAIFVDVSATLRAPGLAVRRSGWGAARVPGEVDEQGWRELAAYHVEFALGTQRIIAKSQTRLRQTAGKPIRVVSANLLLESPPADQPE